MINKFGLSRTIPPDVALEIRRRSKFGCVLCRCAVYQYEHIDPEFADAKAHEPDKMCLLCGGCHDRVTRKRISKETVKAKYAQVQSSNEVDRPFEELDLSASNIRVRLGSAEFQFTHHLLRINGRDLLSIAPPKDGAAFPTLNGVFCDGNGREIFRITDNVWEGPTDAWDIQVVSNSLTIKTQGDRVALLLKIAPPDTVVVEQLDMYLDNCHVVCGADGLLVGQVHDKRYAYIGLGGFVCVGAEAGIDVDSRGGPPVVQSVSMTGGKGVLLNGTGIRLGVGAAQMHIKQLKVWQKAG